MMPAVSNCLATRWIYPTCPGVSTAWWQWISRTALIAASLVMPAVTSIQARAVPVRPWEPAQVKQVWAGRVSMSLCQKSARTAQGAVMSGQLREMTRGAAAALSTFRLGDPNVTKGAKVLGVICPEYPRCIPGEQADWSPHYP